MAEKARDAFRTISEVANWLDVPAHVLRFWESKFTQIKPVKRAGGRRYYRPDDMRLIGGIKQLLHDDGLTIRGVQKMLKEEGVKHVSALSPALDMPSAEEGAARRDARRARRQTRQGGKTDATSGAPAPSGPVTADTDAPVLADPVPSADQSNPVSLTRTAPPTTPSDPAARSEPDSPAITTSQPFAAENTGTDQAPEVTSEDATTPDTTAPMTTGPANTGPADPVPVDTGPDLFGDTGTSHPEAAQAEPDPRPTPAEPPEPMTPPEITEAAPPSPESKAEPTVVPDDPSLDSVQATASQQKHSATLRLLRSRDDSIEIAPEHRATLQTLFGRMQSLQERMIADGVGA